MRKYILSLVVCAFVGIGAWAHPGTDFRLSSNGGHLFFETALCGEPVTVMVESGIPAFLIGQDFRIPVQHLKGSEVDKSIVLIDVPQGRLSGRGSENG